MSNRTQRYLSPSIKLREESFQKLLGDLNKENYYAMDSDYYQAYGLTEVKNYLFVQIDLLGFFNFESKCYINSTEYSLKTYKESLDKIKEFSFFVANYKLKANKFKEILIFELPEVKLKGKIINTVENFLLGKYSELWTKEQLEVMFKPIAGDTSSNYIQNENKRREEVKAVLSKDPRYKYLYVDYIKEKFGTVLNE